MKVCNPSALGLWSLAWPHCAVRDFLANIVQVERRQPCCPCLIGKTMLFKFASLALMA